MIIEGELGGNFTSITTTTNPLNIAALPPSSGSSAPPPSSGYSPPPPPESTSTPLVPSNFRLTYVGTSTIQVAWIALQTQIIIL